jgi:RNA polymerase sigma factor (sigma-70 family)
MRAPIGLTAFAQKQEAAMKNTGAVIDPIDEDVRERLRQLDPECLKISEIVEILKVVWYSKDNELAKPFIETLIKHFLPLLKKHYGRLADLGIEFEDLQGEVFFKLHKSLPLIKQPAAFPGFFSKLVMSVTNNLLKRELKMRDRNGRLDAKDSKDGEYDREGVLRKEEANFERDMIRTILLDEVLLRHKAEFTDQERKTLALIRQGESIHEVANLLGTSVGNVRNIMLRIRKKIRRILSGGA